jgi:hypothetical protein
MFANITNRSLIAQTSYFWAVVLAIALFCVPVWGQDSRGSITGEVRDSSNSVIPNVKIVATNTATNVQSATVTNETGSYTLPFLPPGTYSVSAELQGFKKAVRQEIAVRVGDRLEIGFVLNPADVQSTVEVSAQAGPILDTVSASVGVVVDHRRIAELPLADGNPFTLANLAGGVVYVSEAMNNLRAFDNNGTSALRPSGAPGGNEFSLDGAPNTARKGSIARVGSSVAFVPPAEAVEEFKIETASFDAQHGHATGANVNVSIKSGTNQLHGTAYEFDRPTELVANGFFAKRSGINTGDFIYHRFGGTVGGPVFLPKVYDGRNKSFFFFSYENLMNDRPTPDQLTIPTLAERTGDFSALLSQNIAIYDPLTAKTASGGRIQRTAFPGNIIPRQRLDPIALNLMKYYPQPDLPGDAQGQNNFLSKAVSSNRYNSELFRIDHVLNDRHRMFVRGLANSRDNGGGPGAVGEVNGIKPTKDRFTRMNRGLTYDHLYSMSPTSILDLRAGYTRFRESNEPIAPGFDLAAMGFSSTTLGYFGAARYLPRFNLDNYVDLGYNTPGDVQAHSILFLQPTLTKVRGRHSMRAGYDFRAYRENYGYLQDHAGDYTFSTTYTRGPQDNSTSYVGQDLASLMVGLPTGGKIDRAATTANQTVYHAVFFHDDLRLSSKLTLNLGVRYELEQATTERYNRNVRGFDATTPSPIANAAQAAYAAKPDAQGLAVSAFQVRGGLLFATPDHRGFWNTDTNNIQPRAGLAWRLTPKMVLRGGWGVYMVPFVIDAVQQAGFSQSTSITPSPDSGLTFTGSLANPWPSGVLAPAGASAGLGTYMGQSISVVPLDRKNGLAQRWSVALQRELPGLWLFEAAYQGSKGYDLTVSRNLDPIPAQYLSTSPVRDQTVIDFLGAKVTNPFANLLPGTSLNSSTISRSQLLMPYPQFTAVNSESYDGTTIYHGAQFRAERRMKNGFTFQSAYSYSRLREKLRLLNDTDQAPEDRVSRDDRPHRLAVSGIWEMPVGKGRRFGSNWSRGLDAVLGGWQLGGVFLAQPGRPFTMESRNVYFSGDPNKLEAKFGTDKIGVPVFDISGFYFNDATVQTNGVVSPAKQRADQRIQLSNNIRTFPSILPRLRGDRIIGLDLSLIKTLRINERLKVQLRGESLNTLNRFQFSDPNTSPTSSSFGLVTGTSNPARQMQFAIKLLF